MRMLGNKMFEGKKGRGIFYSLVFLISFLLFIYLGFPYKSLKDRLLFEVNRKIPVEIEAGDLDISPGLRMRFSDVRLYKGSSTLLFDEVVADLSWMDLLGKEIDIPFHAVGAGGEFSGIMLLSKAKGSLRSLKVEFEKVDASKLSRFILGDKTNVNIGGELEGVVNLNIDKRGAVQIVKGTYKVNSSNFSLSGAKIGYFDIPGYERLLLEFEGSFDGQRTRIERLSFRNNDFHLNLFGTVPPLWKISKGGKLDLALNLTLYSDEAKLGFLKAFLRPHKDGTLKAKVAGTFSNPRLLNISGKRDL